MRLALYQPDIAQNTATIIRLGVCMGVCIDIIEPCGFQFTDKGFKRAGMDYLDMAEVTRHASWEAFRPPGRLVLLTTRVDRAYADFAFEPSDTLLFGRESAGVPDEVHASADARLRIPMRAGLRSVNVALAAAMALGEALRQTDGFPA